MQLVDYIGKEIVVMIPFLSRERLQTVKLLGVEAGGIWVESQAFINAALTTLDAIATTNKIPVVFFPYSQIVLIGGAIDGMALNEKAFGV